MADDIHTNLTEVDNGILDIDKVPEYIKKAKNSVENALSELDNDIIVPDFSTVITNINTSLVTYNTIVRKLNDYIDDSVDYENTNKKRFSKESGIDTDSDSDTITIKNDTENIIDNPEFNNDEENYITGEEQPSSEFTVSNNQSEEVYDENVIASLLGGTSTSFSTSEVLTLRLGPINPSTIPLDSEYSASLLNNRKNMAAYANILLDYGFQEEDINKIITNAVTVDNLQEEVQKTEQEIVLEACNDNNYSRFDSYVLATLFNQYYFNRQASIARKAELEEELATLENGDNLTVSNDSYQKVYEEAKFDSKTGMYNYTDENGTTYTFTKEELECIPKLIDENGDLTANDDREKQIELIKQELATLNINLSDSDKIDFEYTSIDKLDKRIEELENKKTDIKSSMIKSSDELSSSHDVIKSQLEEKQLNSWFRVNNSSNDSTGWSCIKIGSDKYVIMDADHNYIATDGSKDINAKYTAEELIDAGVVLDDKNYYTSSEIEKLDLELSEVDVELKQLKEIKLQIETSLENEHNFGKYFRLSDETLSQNVSYDVDKNMLDVYNGYGSSSLGYKSEATTYAYLGCLFQAILNNGFEGLESPLGNNTEELWIDCNKLSDETKTVFQDSLTYPYVSLDVTNPNMRDNIDNYINWSKVLNQSEYSRVKNVINYICNSSPDGYEKAYNFLMSISTDVDNIYVNQKTIDDYERANSSVYALALYETIALLGKPLEAIANNQRIARKQSAGKKIYASDTYLSTDTYYKAALDYVNNNLGSTVGGIWKTFYSVDSVLVNIMETKLLGGSKLASFATSAFNFGSTTFNEAYNDAVNRNVGQDEAIQYATIRSLSHTVARYLSFTNLSGMEASFNSASSNGGIMETIDNILLKYGFNPNSKLYEVAEKTLLIGYCGLNQGAFGTSTALTNQMIGELADLTLCGDLSQFSTDYKLYKINHPEASDFEAYAYASRNVYDRAGNIAVDAFFTSAVVGGLNSPSLSSAKGYRIGNLKPSGEVKFNFKEAFKQYDDLPSSPNKGPDGGGNISDTIGVKVPVDISIDEKKGDGYTIVEEKGPSNNPNSPNGGSIIKSDSSSEVEIIEAKPLTELEQIDNYLNELSLEERLYVINTALEDSANSEYYDYLNNKLAETHEMMGYSSTYKSPTATMVSLQKGADLLSTSDASSNKGYYTAETTMAMTADGGSKDVTNRVWVTDSSSSSNEGSIQQVPSTLASEGSVQQTLSNTSSNISISSAQTTTGSTVTQVGETTPSIIETKFNIPINYPSERVANATADSNLLSRLNVYAQTFSKILPTIAEVKTTNTATDDTKTPSISFDRLAPHSEVTAESIIAQNKSNTSNETDSTPLKTIAQIQEEYSYLDRLSASRQIDAINSLLEGSNLDDETRNYLTNKRADAEITTTNERHDSLMKASISSDNKVTETTSVVNGVSSNSSELYHVDTMPQSEIPKRQAAIDKILNGKKLNIGDKLALGGRDHVVKEIDGYQLKPDHVYRVIDIEAWEDYVKNGKVVRNAPEFIPGENNGGVDWYLGGSANPTGRYSAGENTIIIEAPADKKYFTPSVDNGLGMADDISVRHMKSSSQANPVPLSMVTVIKGQDVIDNWTSIQNFKAILGKEISDVTQNKDGTITVTTRYGEKLNITKDGLNSQNFEHEILEKNREYEKENNVEAVNTSKSETISETSDIDYSSLSSKELVEVLKSTTPSETIKVTYSDEEIDGIKTQLESLKIENDTFRNGVIDTLIGFYDTQMKAGNPYIKTIANSVINLLSDDKFSLIEETNGKQSNASNTSIRFTNEATTNPLKLNHEPAHAIHMRNDTASVNEVRIKKDGTQGLTFDGRTDYEKNPTGTIAIYNPKTGVYEFNGFNFTKIVGNACEKIEDSSNIFWKINQQVFDEKWLLVREFAIQSQMKKHSLNHDDATTRYNNIIKGQYSKIDAVIAKAKSEENGIKTLFENNKLSYYYSGEDMEITEELKFAITERILLSTNYKDDNGKKSSIVDDADDYVNEHLTLSAFSAIADIVDAITGGKYSHILASGHSSKDTAYYSGDLNGTDLFDKNGVQVADASRGIGNQCREAVAQFITIMSYSPNSINILKEIIGQEYFDMIMSEINKIYGEDNSLALDISVDPSLETKTSDQNIEIIDVSKIDTEKQNGRMARGVDPNIMNISYKGYDFVYKTSGDVDSVIEQLCSDSRSGKVLLELDSTKGLTLENLGTLPENVEIRVLGNYGIEYFNGFPSNYNENALASLHNVTYSVSEMKRIIRDINDFEERVQSSWDDVVKANFAYKYLTELIANKCVLSSVDGIEEINGNKEYDGLMGLVSGNSSDKGFAHIYKELLDRMGIQCVEVQGILKSSTKNKEYLNCDGYHVFNVIIIDGKSIIVDVSRDFLSLNYNGSGFGVINQSEYKFKSFEELADNLITMRKLKIEKVAKEIQKKFAKNRTLADEGEIWDFESLFSGITSSNTERVHNIIDWAKTDGINKILDFFDGKIDINKIDLNKLIILEEEEFYALLDAMGESRNTAGFNIGNVSVIGVPSSILISSSMYTTIIHELLHQISNPDDYCFWDIDEETFYQISGFDITVDKGDLDRKITQLGFVPTPYKGFNEAVTDYFAGLILPEGSYMSGYNNAVDGLKRIISLNIPGFDVESIKNGYINNDISILKNVIDGVVEEGFFENELCPAFNKAIDSVHGEVILEDAIDALETIFETNELLLAKYGEHYMSQNKFDYVKFKKLLDLFSIEDFYNKPYAEQVEMISAIVDYDCLSPILKDIIILNENIQTIDTDKEENIDVVSISKTDETIVGNVEVSATTKFDDILESIDSGEFFNKTIDEQKNMVSEISNDESVSVDDRISLLALLLEKSAANQGLTIKELSKLSGEGIVSQDLLDKANILANDLFEKAKIIEPSITKLMHSFEDDNCILIGIEKNLKFADSIARKIALDSNNLSQKDEYKSYSMDELLEVAASKIGDTVRYTMLIDPSNYKQKSLEVLKKFKNDGYEIIKASNTWNNTIYKGLNVSIKTPDGIVFEVQFHTTDSFIIKDIESHIYYEIKRNEYVSEMDKYIADEIQKLFTSTIEIPDGVVGFDYIEALDNESAKSMGNIFSNMFVNYSESQVVLRKALKNGLLDNGVLNSSEKVSNMIKVLKSLQLSNISKNTIEKYTTSKGFDFQGFLNYGLLNGLFDDNDIFELSKIDDIQNIISNPSKQLKNISIAIDNMANLYNTIGNDAITNSNFNYLSFLIYYVSRDINFRTAYKNELYNLSRKIDSLSTRYIESYKNLTIQYRGINITTYGTDTVFLETALKRTLQMIEILPEALKIQLSKINGLKIYDTPDSGNLSALFENKNIFKDPKYKAFISNGSYNRSSNIISLYKHAFWCQSDEQLFDIISHELGHALDSTLFGRFEYFTENTKIWENAKMIDNNSVSDYGDTKIVEDFAETVSLFARALAGYRNINDVCNKYMMRINVLKTLFAIQTNDKNTIDNISFNTRLQILSDCDSFISGNDTSFIDLLLGDKLINRYNSFSPIEKISLAKYMLNNGVSNQFINKFINKNFLAGFTTDQLIELINVYNGTTNENTVISHIIMLEENINLKSIDELNALNVNTIDEGIFRRNIVNIIQSSEKINCISLYMTFMQFKEYVSTELFESALKIVLKYGE